MNNFSSTLLQQQQCSSRYLKNRSMRHVKSRSDGSGNIFITTSAPQHSRGNLFVARPTNKSAANPPVCPAVLKPILNFSSMVIDAGYTTSCDKTFLNVHLIQHIHNNKRIRTTEKKNNKTNTTNLQANTNLPPGKTTISNLQMTCLGKAVLFPL